MSIDRDEPATGMPTLDRRLIKARNDPRPPDAWQRAVLRRYGFTEADVATISKRAAFIWMFRWLRRLLGPERDGNGRATREQVARLLALGECPRRASRLSFEQAQRRLEAAMEKS